MTYRCPECGAEYDEQIVCVGDPENDLRNHPSTPTDTEPVKGGSKASESDLDSLNKDRLLALADERDLDVNSRSTKAEILAALRG